MSDAPAAPAPAPPKLEGRAYLRLVGLGALIGIPAAGLAALFFGAEHAITHLLWTDLPQQIGVSAPPWYLVIGLPVVGAAIVIGARRLLPGDGGHAPLLGLAAPPPPIAYLPGVVVAALGTLCFGVVLGPEGPIIAIGTIMGLIVATLLGAVARDGGETSPIGRILGSAGAFSAVSALFDGPIIGGLLLTEGGVALGARLIPALVPGFVAAALGYVLFVGIGSWQGLNHENLQVPHLPAYTTTRIADLVIAVAVGIVTALLIHAVRTVAARIERDAPRRLGMPGALLLGGLAVGLTAQIASWLGANSQTVLFSGQAGLPNLIAQTSTGIVLVLLLGKAIAYMISLGCGFRGGPIFPAIFLGVAVATLPIVWFGTSPTLAVAAGAAAGIAATAKFMLTPIVFAALLVGTAGIDAVPAAVLAAAAAWLVVTALDARSERAQPAAASKA